MDVPVAKTNTQRAVMSKKMAAVVILLVALSVASAFYFSPALPKVNYSDVWISEVQAGKFTRKVRGVGVLAPSEIRWIAANSPGRVERILVKPGAQVNQDTVIAELSNPDLMSLLQQARWELDAAEANLLALTAQLHEQRLDQELNVIQARMALESAELKEEAEQPLAEQNIISAINFANTQLTTEQRQAELNIALETQERRIEVVEAKLAAEQAQVRKYNNMVQLYENQMAALIVKADIEGVLQQVSIDVGQRVDIGTNIARVARPDSLIAELQVQENRVQELHLGLPVSIDTRNGLVAGVVKRIDPRVENGNVQIDVELVGALPSGARPDLSVTGTIVVEEIENALFIDRPAGVTAMSNTDLFILNSAKDTAQAKQISLGKASVSSIQILAGLQEGDAVIVSDMLDFSQHASIAIVN